MSEVVYGSEIAKDIKENLKVKIDQLKAEGKRTWKRKSMSICWYGK